MLPKGVLSALFATRKKVVKISMKKNVLEKLKRIVVIIFAALLMSININTFVHAGGLYPGGATGLTVLIQRVGKEFFHIALPYTFINLALNAIPIYIGFRFIGKRFTLYSCLMIVLTSVFTDILPVHAITYDVLLISIFGGLFNGLAISLCLGVNATTGGTDFISIFLSEKKGVDSWNIVLGINVVIIGSAGLLFGWDKALYSMIFQYVSTQVLHTLYKKYQKETLFVVTNQPKEICEVIYKLTRHGATILEGEGSYEHCERYVVYSVVSRAESERLMAGIKELDPKAFVNSVQSDSIIGQFYQEPND